MTDFKKSTDHLTNAALSVPFLLATGNIGAAIAAVGLGKLLDYVEDKKFEERRERWKNDPNSLKLAKHWTQEELDELDKKNNLATSIINELPEFQKAPRIPCHYDFNHLENIHIGFYGIGGIQRCDVRDGEIIFYKSVGTIIKRKPAKLFCEKFDFLNAYNKDSKIYHDIKIYGLPASYLGVNHSKLPDEWMYTVDNGRTYVAVTNYVR